ncbi:FliM/FliN family flagellar motor switch protein, partial [Rhodoblastus sp.]|uniref:FliM/FliN family flagellar motor switch protein n=1 Tax=Rhodoblastus sp. TaxID=1962975 RepID=UPI003F9B934A
PRWQKLMHLGVQKAEIAAIGILDEKTVMLGEISQWRVGDILPVNASALSKVRLDCKNQPLFWCDLGQSRGHYTLKVSDRVDVDEMPLAQFLALAGATEAK